MLLLLATSLLSLPLVIPSSEPYSQEWYYRLGDQSYGDEKFKSENLYVRGCGTFAGYYRVRSDNVDFAGLCEHLTPTDSLQEDRCALTLVVVEVNQTLTRATCKRVGDGCILDATCASE